MRLPVIFIVVLLILALIIDGIILYALGAKGVRHCKRSRIWYAISCIPFYGLLIAMFCMNPRSENDDVLPLMWIVFTFVSVYIAKALYAIFSIIGVALNKVRQQKEKAKARRNILGYIGLGLGAVMLALLWIGVFSTRRVIDVERVRVESSRLPDAFDGYRIVQFSDAHVGTWGTDTTFISNLVDSINGVGADMIVFTGDIVNRRTEELRPFLNILSRLHARDGVYSRLGNHDYGDYIDWKNPAEREANNQLLAKWEKDMGWDLLNNEYRTIRRDSANMMLIGVENWGEPPFPTYGNLKKAYGPTSRYPERNLNDSNFKILLSHNPEHWVREVTKESNIDLTLSGHTHAMQSMIKIGSFKWSPCVFKYKTWGGLYKNEEDGTDHQIYVNIGSGEVGMPSRVLNAYPEVTVIELKKKS